MRKKTVQWTVFADVATSASEAIGAVAPGQNPFQRARKKHLQLQVLFLVIFAYGEVCKAYHFYEIGTISLNM